MKYVVNLLCFCISYSYLTGSSVLSHKKFKLPRRNNVLDLVNNAKEIRSPNVAKKIYSPNNGKVNVKNLGKYLLRRNHHKSSEAGSSTREKFEFKNEFKKEWALKQYEALNASVPGGDQVYMVAARPWGTPCGDPNQQDAPWGTCMLSMECDVEFRIYRGDYFCGRTDFICCGLLDNVYDLNAPFDNSFASDQFDVSSEEMRNQGVKEAQAKLKVSGGKKQRHTEREARKKSMKDLIEKIVREIRELLNKANKNSSKVKAKKTKQLRIFLAYLKKQYKKDRQSVMDIQDVESIRIDVALRNKLLELSQMNANFMKNETFRNMVINGPKTMKRSEAKMLMQAYPDLQEYFIRRRNEYKKDPLVYDVEYGLMYY